MDFYILIFPRDTQYIVFGALLYVFSRSFSVSCIHCYRKNTDCQGTCENVMWKSKIYNITFWWRLETCSWWFSKFVSEVVNLKLYTTLPPTIRYLESSKFCIWHCPMFFEGNRTVLNSTKVTILIAVSLGAYSSYGIGGTQTNYAWLVSPNISLCSFDSAQVYFRCGWKREC